MNIVFWAAQVVFGLVLVLVLNSKPQGTKEPANLYYDCCDVGLDAAQKENCVFAAQAKDHILTERNGDTKTYLWSNCRPGHEPWRRFDVK